MKLTFFAPGIPAPKGSARSFKHRITGAIVTIQDSKRLKPWEGTVALAARAAGARLSDQPHEIRVTFWLPRPKSHSGKRGLKPGAPLYPSRPDLDKLLRAILDALTGVCWVDDGQVALVVTAKRYAVEECGAEVAVVELEAAGELFERSA